MTAGATQAQAGPALACVEMYDMAAREALKAWHNTSLLSKVRRARVEDVIKAFSGGDAGQISAFLSDLAGTCYDGYAVKSGADAGSLMRMAGIIMKTLCRDLRASGDEEGVLDSLTSIYARTRAWIQHGRFEGCSEDLMRYSELIGDDPRARLGLMAPFAPAIAITQFVTRASKANVPLTAGSN